MSNNINNNKKLLEGIRVNDTLLQHWKDALTMANNNTNTTTNSNGESSSIVSEDRLSTAMAELRRTNKKEEEEEARRNNPFSTKHTPTAMPLSVLQAIQIMYQERGTVDKLVSLEEALKASSSLVFSSPPPSPATTTTTSNSGNNNQSTAAYQRRMDRLRLQLEESKYHKLTNNLQKDQPQDDDITAKSMTFAASVGLNMIIAPLSFGCFMYFFAGGLLDFFFQGDDFQQKNISTRNGSSTAVDIKRVIIGVISGVVMMIIEMLLFVIRTHELEEHSRRKKKKKNGAVEPFGVYSTNTPAVYSDERKGDRTTKPIAATKKKNDLVKKQR